MNLKIAVLCSFFFAQIRHTVRYLVIPTRTGLKSAKMPEQQTTRPRSRSSARGCISGYVIVCNKMAWSAKHPLESASNSLLENRFTEYDFFPMFLPRIIHGKHISYLDPV